MGINSLGLKLTSIFISLGVLFGVLIVMDGFVSIGAGEVGVVFDRGRGVLDRTIPEGLHLKIPFWQTVSVYSVKTQEYTMSKVGSEGAVYGDDSIYARSQDGQQVTMDATVLFHLEASNAPYIKKTIGDEEDYLRIIVRPKTRSLLREVVASHNALDLVSAKRSDIVDEMSNALVDSFNIHHITFDEVVLRDISFSDEFSYAIEEKQIAFQKIKTAEFKKQEAEQIKEKKIIEAEGDAKAIELKGLALKNSPEVIQLQFVEKMADDIKWGILPDGVMPLMDLQSLQEK